MIAQAYALLSHLGNPIAIFGDDFCASDGAGCDTGLPKTDAGSTQLHDVLSVAFAVLAALSVLFIVIAAFRLVTAHGDSQQASKARSTIVYALAGLVVAMLAEAFVAFVLDKLV